MESNICGEAVRESNIAEAELDNYLEVAKQAASIGGKVLMKYYGKIVSINQKSREGDLVTNADIEAENLIVSFLKEKTPECGIFAEEGGISGGNSHFVWCIDPLDGTTNYTHGYPFFATSVGLLWNEKPLLGAINVPFSRELYWGSPGKGAFCNEEKISVSKSNKLVDSLLVTGFSYDRSTKIDNNYAEFCWLTNKTRGVRRGGAAAVDLAFIASGRLDGYWEQGLSPWDLAAGIAIVESAGGVICDYKSNKFELKKGRILASNPYIKSELLLELEKVNPLDQKSFGGKPIN